MHELLYLLFLVYCAIGKLIPSLQIIRVWEKAGSALPTMRPQTKKPRLGHATQASISQHVPIRSPGPLSGSEEGGKRRDRGRLADKGRSKRSRISLFGDAGAEDEDFQCALSLNFLLDTSIRPQIYKSSTVRAFFLRLICANKIQHCGSTRFPFPTALICQQESSQCPPVPASMPTVRLYLMVSSTACDTASMQSTACATEEGRGGG